jgi:MFS family permease
VRARVECRRADRVARGAGDRGGDHLARGAVDRDDHVQRRRGAEQALGIWGALGGSGAAAGVLLGGILTKYLGWEWIFFVNVPVGAIVLVLTRPIVPESHADLGHRRFDAVGAVSVTGGVALLVYAISKAPDDGWATGSTIGLLLASVAILAGSSSGSCARPLR